MIICKIYIRKKYKSWNQKDSKIQLSTVPFKPRWSLLFTTGQLPLTIKLDFQHIQRNVKDQNIDLSLKQITTAEAYQDDCRLPHLQFNWHQFLATSGKE